MFSKGDSKHVGRGAPAIADWGRFWMPCTKVIAQSGCYTRFKILLEVPHPLLTLIFSHRIYTNQNIDLSEKCKDKPPSLPRGATATCGKPTFF